MNPLFVEDRRLALRAIAGLVAFTVVIILAWPGLVRGLFTHESFMPHGHCYFWTPGLVWLHFSTDLLIALSYFAISATLVLIVKRSKGDVPFPVVMIAFGIFIVACGATHAVGVVTIWKPMYWFSGSVKMITAVASFATALLLPPLVPRVLQLVEDARVSGERKRKLITAEDQRDAAEAASRAKDEFLANLSHELRTPMTAIIGWASMLRAGIENDEEREAAVDSIVESARVQSRLIEDLLDVSRIVSSKLTISLEPVDLVGLLERAIETLSHQSESRGVEVELSSDSESAVIEGDEHRLMQVFLNLLSNAIKFSERGDRVSVLIGVRETEATIVVRDQGAGISPEFLPRVFDRFSQEDGTSTREFGGLGLGLAIVRHIVELHGGEVSARSDGPGQGAEFTVRLPLAG